MCLDPRLHFYCLAGCHSTARQVSLEAAESPAELRSSLRELRERHEQLMTAAREEIAALRASLQQAYGELARCKAGKLCLGDFEAARAAPVELRGLVPRALLKSWRDSSWQQLMDLYLSAAVAFGWQVMALGAWREQALEAQRPLEEGFKLLAAGIDKPSRSLS